MKKILIVVPGCRTGGVRSSLLALLNSSFVERYAVSLFIMNTYGEEEIPEFKKYSIGKNIGTSLLVANITHQSGIRRLILILFKLIIRIPYLGRAISNLIEKVTISIIEKERYDCIISFQEVVSLPFVARFSNSNKIAWIHCDYSRIFTNEEDEYSIFSKYSKIVTVSEYTKDSFCKLLPSLVHKVFSVYNIMDTETIIQKSKEPIEDELFKHDVFTIISVGRISAIKQFDTIPLIASELKSKGIDFHWYILGNIAEIESYYRLLQSIEEYSVKDNVVYIGNKSNPYPYFKAANLLVSTSRSEACPMIFNEAKILNIPVVTNNFGSASEFIADGFDGRICSLNEISGAIETIVKNDIQYIPHISNSFREEYIQERIDLIIN